MKIVLALLLLALFSWPCHATEQYAAQTGKSCSACHLDPAGGGELTAEGKAFSASKASPGKAPGVSAPAKAPNVSAPAQASGITAAAKVFRFVIGYIHMLTAILWFGTILYVHLVLKPAYAAGGLPRGEVRVGVLSMAVMGITGIVLTYFRVTSWDMLLHTRFGVLLMIKIGLYLVMVCTAAYVVLFIGPKLKAKRREPATLPQGGDLTIDELASCDGKEGRPAWFAYQGKLYDATASRLWKQGVHMGRHNAGEDLTEALKLAPHGSEKVAIMPAVGALVAQTDRKAPLHERVFFFMAYMNLSIVFLVVLILALWRWA
ncbi:CopD family protein [Citrifermentans bemidjiense]|nr:CopD family protein [Citrifermentans bemidjiense]